MVAIALPGEVGAARSDMLTGRDAETATAAGQRVCVSIVERERMAAPYPRHLAIATAQAPATFQFRVGIGLAVSRLDPAARPHSMVRAAAIVA
jgi:hypothetical protein